ncbi:uncharacterized protein [Watersipora subatra]|uniref:uncharacterized protein n=1 Tax=Watersipora subatra TaxID=2589382 RepID=UPI00355B7E10
MPSSRSCMKDERVTACIKSRNPLGVIVLALVLFSSAFFFTAYYIYNINVNKPTTQPFSQGLSSFMVDLSAHNWCPNVSIGQEELSLPNDTYTTTQSLSKLSSACLQVVTIISGEHYPAFKNSSLYQVTLSRSRIFHEGTDLSDELAKVQLTYFIQHNLSTSTRSSRDVLVPTYVNISSLHQLPKYIRDASTCQFSPNVRLSMVQATSCHSTSPHFHIDQKWEHNLDIFVSVDEGRINIHLMYTSYFLLISAISLIAYNMIRNRNTLKNSNKNKLPQKMPIVVY